MKKAKKQKMAIGPSKKSPAAGPINQHKMLAMGMSIPNGSNEKGTKEKRRK